MGETRHGRYLEQRERQFRAGARLLAAVTLLVASSCAANVALFGAGMRDFRFAFSRIHVDPIVQSAGSILPWLLVASAVVLAATVVAQHRWLGPALGAWLTALIITVATVWAYSLPGQVDFASFFTLMATTIGAVLYWAVRRFGAPAA